MNKSQTSFIPSISAPIPLATLQLIVMGEPPAYTIDEFCEAHRISKPALYEMVAEGRGPKVIRKGTSGIIIPREAAEEWRRAQAEEWTTSKPRTGAGRRRS